MDVEAEPLEQQREGSVEVIAVAAAAPQDSVHRLDRIDGGGSTEPYLQALVGDAFRVCSM